MGVPWDELASHSGGVALLILPLCNRKPDMHDRLFGMYADFTFTSINKLLYKSSQ